MQLSNYNKQVESNLLLFCNGDNNAITQQYKEWLSELCFFAYKYLKSEEDSEDVVSDCFEKLLRIPNELRKQKI